MNTGCDLAGVAPVQTTANATCYTYGLVRGCKVRKLWWWSYFCIQENSVGNVVCEMDEILSWPKCVNKANAKSVYRKPIEMNYLNIWGFWYQNCNAVPRLCCTNEKQSYELAQKWVVWFVISKRNQHWLSSYSFLQTKRNTTWLLIHYRKPDITCYVNGWRWSTLGSHADLVAKPRISSICLNILDSTSYTRYQCSTVQYIFQCS